MTKTERQQVQIAVNFARVDPRYAAATLSTVMRSCSRKTLIELLEVANSTGLRDHMTVINGAYVAVPA